MKKLLSLLTLLICTMGAMAQDWVNPHNNYPGGHTIVFANFVVTNSNNAVYEGNYTLAAFVGDECRWSEKDNGSSHLLLEGGGEFLEIRVPGNYDNVNDMDKSIKFYAMDNMGNIYELIASTTLTYGSEARFGEP